MRGDEVVDILEFPSLEAFLTAYLIVSGESAGDISDLVSRYWSSTSNNTDLIKVAEGADFESLETLFLPVGIPYDFEIGRIRVSELGVVFHFFQRDDMISEYAMQEAYWQQRYFNFFIERWDESESTLFNDMMQAQGVTEKDLIDGKYLFRPPNSFSWVSEGGRFGLRLPLQQSSINHETIMTTEIDGLPLNNPYEMVKFTETRAVNLLDTNEVMTLIMEITNTVQNDYEHEAENDYTREDHSENEYDAIKLEFNVQDGMVLYYGDEFQLEWAITPASLAATGEAEFASTSPYVAEVDSGGLITVNDIGETIITITVPTEQGVLRAEFTVFVNVTPF